MSTIINGSKRNGVAELTSLSRNLYENIFKVQLIEKDDKAFYAYNLLNKVIFPDNLDSALIDEVVVHGDKPWTIFLWQKLEPPISILSQVLWLMFYSN